MNESKEKKQKLEDIIVDLSKEAVSLAHQAEKKNDMTLLAKSNAFRRKIPEKQSQVDEANKQVGSLIKDELKHCDHYE